MRASSTILPIALWIAAVAVPVAACAVAVGQIPDVAEIPYHWNSSGEADSWGPPGRLAGIFWFIGVAMSATNLIMALLFALNDRMYDAGLVNGVSRDGALKVYVACAILMDILVAVILACILVAVRAAL